MCGRYVLYGPHSRLKEYFVLQACPAWEARYNIAPQSEILVVRERPGTGRVGQGVRWGLIPRWATNPDIGHKLNNARAETVAEMPSFKARFERPRCLLPAAESMVCFPVSSRVSSGRNQGPELIEPT